MEERDKEMHDSITANSEKEKQRFLEVKNDKEELQRKIEDLTIENRDLQIEYKNHCEKAEKDLHVAKRDFFIIQEEKRMLIRRITEVQQDLDYIREDYDNKVRDNETLQQEIKMIEEKCEELDKKEKENYRIRVNLESSLKAKTDEMDKQVKTYNDNINLLKKTSGYAEIREEYEKRLNQVIQRKEYYKNKVQLLIKFYY